MQAEKRREQILALLLQSDQPLSASYLSKTFGVSRQGIVGDIALLRAQGREIIATSRGYLAAPVVPSGRYLGKLACQHTLEQTEKELSMIVAYGAEVLDVIVEHYFYGEITGQLNIATQKDVDAFMDNVRENKARLLSELTGGVHLHTISCRDVEHFRTVQEALREQGLLYSGH